MNIEIWHRHALLNRLQSLILLAAIAGFMALLGWLLWGVYGVILLLLAAAILLLFNPATRPQLIMRMYRASPLTAWETPRLIAVMKELARRAGLPAVPVLYYVPSRMVNAFAVGTPDLAAIAVTDGLLRTLDLRETAGVRAHAQRTGAARFVTDQGIRRRSECRATHGRSRGSGTCPGQDRACSGQLD